MCDYLCSTNHKPSFQRFKYSKELQGWNLTTKTPHEKLIGEWQLRFGEAFISSRDYP
jgi:hypothetical protein